MLNQATFVVLVQQFLIANLINKTTAHAHLAMLVSLLQVSLALALECHTVPAWTWALVNVTLAKIATPLTLSLDNVLVTYLVILMTLL